MLTMDQTPRNGRSSVQMRTFLFDQTLRATLPDPGGELQNFLQDYQLKKYLTRECKDRNKLEINDFVGVLLRLNRDVIRKQSMRSTYCRKPMARNDMRSMNVMYKESGRDPMDHHSNHTKDIIQSDIEQQKRITCSLEQENVTDYGDNEQLQNYVSNYKNYIVNDSVCNVNIHDNIVNDNIVNDKVCNDNHTDDDVASDNDSHVASENITTDNVVRNIIFNDNLNKDNTNNEIREGSIVKEYDYSKQIKTHLPMTNRKHFLSLENNTNAPAMLRVNSRYKININEIPRLKISEYDNDPDRINFDNVDSFLLPKKSLDFPLTKRVQRNCLDHSLETMEYPERREFSNVVRVNVFSAQTRNTLSPNAFRTSFRLRRAKRQIVPENENMNKDLDQHSDSKGKILLFCNNTSGNKPSPAGTPVPNWRQLYNLESKYNSVLLKCHDKQTKTNVHGCSQMYSEKLLHQKQKQKQKVVQKRKQNRSVIKENRNLIMGYLKDSVPDTREQPIKVPENHVSTSHNSVVKIPVCSVLSEGEYSSESSVISDIKDELAVNLNCPIESPESVVSHQSELKSQFSSKPSNPVNYENVTTSNDNSEINLETNFNKLRKYGITSPTSKRALISSRRSTEFLSRFLKFEESNNSLFLK